MDTSRANASGHNSTWRWPGPDTRGRRAPGHHYGGDYLAWPHHVVCLPDHPDANGQTAISPLKHIILALAVDRFDARPSL